MFTPSPSTGTHPVLRAAKFPFVWRCCRCCLQQAGRLGDAAWGCTCQRTIGPGVTRDRGREKVLFRDAGPTGVEWWDHETNDEGLFATLSPKARRAVHRRCPTCVREFEAPVSQMAEHPTCPSCVREAKDRWEAERDRWSATPVADVPELLAAWPDEDDPQEVMVYSNRLRVLPAQWVTDHAPAHTRSSPTAAHSARPRGPRPSRTTCLPMRHRRCRSSGTANATAGGHRTTSRSPLYAGSGGCPHAATTHGTRVLPVAARTGGCVARSARPYSTPSSGSTRR